MSQKTLQSEEAEPMQATARTLPQDDRYLITRILLADTSAESVFIQRYDCFIRAIIYNCLPGTHPQEREDLRQQAFVLLWENHCRRLRQWRSLPATPFKAYLAKIVRHLVVDHIRSNARYWRNRVDYCASSVSGCSDTDMEDCLAPQMCRIESDPQCLLERKEQQLVIDTALATLSERDRALIYQKHLKEMTYREIAEALGITIGHVGVALARAELRLRRRLQAEDAEIYPKE
jgi:RNA polymerase sigma factor (sigma-70 family)